MGVMQYSNKITVATSRSGVLVVSLHSQPRILRVSSVCSAYEECYQNNPPIPTVVIKQMLRFILQENSFKFTNKHFMQLCGTAMGNNALIVVNPEGRGGGEGGADVGHLTFSNIVFKFPTLGTKILVKIDQISPPKIYAQFFVNFLVIYNTYTFLFYRIFRFLF